MSWALLFFSSVFTLIKNMIQISLTKLVNYHTGLLCIQQEKLTKKGFQSARTMTTRLDQKVQKASLTFQAIIL